MANVKPWQIIGNEIDLPMGTALWVLLAHLLTLLSPLTVIWSVNAYREYLDTVMYAPQLLYASAVVMMIASAFEIAQNTFDRWYLVAQPPALCDFLFASLIMLSMAINVVAYLGNYWWLVTIALLLVLLFSFWYLTGGNIDIPRSILGVISALSFFYVIQDPIVFLPFVSIYLTVLFLEVLLKTQAQSMHGFLTVIHGVFLLCTPLAIHNSATGQRIELMTVITIASVIVVCAVLIKPQLLKLQATPRRLPS